MFLEIPEQNVSFAYFFTMFTKTNMLNCEQNYWNFRNFPNKILWAKSFIQEMNTSRNIFGPLVKYKAWFWISLHFEIRDNTPITYVKILNKYERAQAIMNKNTFENSLLAIFQWTQSGFKRCLSAGWKFKNENWTSETKTRFQFNK